MVTKGSRDIIKNILILIYKNEYKDKTNKSKNNKYMIIYKKR
jgi:hypothetical protein